jgi:hypothetical protein
MSKVQIRETTPELHEDSRGFTVRWSEAGFASVLRCRFGFVLFTPPPVYRITFKRFEGESGSMRWHDDRAGFDAVVVPLLVGRNPKPPPLVMLMHIRFAQRLEGLPTKLRLHIGSD